jgi:tripartite-type tricarboxylate transporter receptor subunit TctC
VLLRAAACLPLGGLFAAVDGCSEAAPPLRIIVPLSPGSTGDVVARRLVDGLTKQLGRSVYVDNIPGAGSVIGTTQMVKAAKDGNTIEIVSSSFVDNPGIYPNMPFDTLRDITPIGIIGDSPQVLVTSVETPAKTLPDLIALARAKPGSLHYGSSGNGTSIHLMAVMLAKEAGIDIQHVPYKGAGPMLTGLLGGQVQLGFLSTTVTAPYIKTGKLRAMGIASKGGSRLLPDVAPLAQQGLPEFDLSIWMAVLAQAELEQGIVNRLNQAVNSTLQMSEVKSWFDSQDWNLKPTTPAEAKTFVAAEQAKHLQLLKDAGVKPA